ncbi:cysteine hydrolase family protein [Caulobacter segnis]|uniref:Isochorismatase n=1 Tax=Caulobacter segnis TaxID=88688 RepID=A0A2W5VA91_9CAUL|nr:isochorismatase family cysteine hydrolase [Caulobacter segnis]PZR36690.1 MAG: isochorismatase [Caulobacter segnis]
MADRAYVPSRTALILVDVFNDFLSEGGKLWPLVRPVAESVDLLENLGALLTAARDAGLTVIYAPHRRWEPGDYEGWSHPNPSQQSIAKFQTFARGTWGGDWRDELAPREGEIVVQEHWAQSSFANTDLDFQLKQHGISHVILAGLLANTCIGSTARYAMELGYHVTLVRDATAAFSPEMMHAAHDLDGPTYAHAILTTQALAAGLKSTD